jgi:hypothetical protein
MKKMNKAGEISNGKKYENNNTWSEFTLAGNEEVR